MESSVPVAGGLRVLERPDDSISAYGTDGQRVFILSCEV